MTEETWVVSYGGGTNSSAILVGMHERGMRPDLTMMADTGDERPHTYAHLQVMQDWCAKVGFPPITVIKNDLPQGVKDGSLYGECMRLGTMPSKVFGRSGCSQKWKLEPQYKYMRKWMAERGIERVQHVVGFDADEIERATKRNPIREFELERYLLIEWDWGRDECKEAMTRAGLPQAGKSACWHCPSSKKPEVMELKRMHPQLYLKAIAMERRAINGEGQAPIARVDGLGRHWNWATFAGSDVGGPEVDCGCYDGSPE